MNRSMQMIPLATIGLVLTDGCQTGSEDEPDPLVGEWVATRVADDDFPYHYEDTYMGYYGQFGITIDVEAELSIYEDLSGYFDMFIHEVYTYNGEEYPYDGSRYMTVHVPSVESGGKYQIVLRSDGEVSKLDCTLEEPELDCTDQFERAWNFERK